MPTRREVLSTVPHACTATAAAAFAGASLQDAEPGPARQRFFIFSMTGCENPTRANFPFVWAAALSEAGHDVRLELAGDATVLMRDVVVDNTTAVGWAPMKDFVAKVREYEIPIYV